LEGCFRSGKVDDHLTPVKERGNIVGDRKACAATARCLSRVVT
jgi:hypothetical protein